MTSIASPRDSSLTGRRIPLISTPTSSSRPSIETPRSQSASPNRLSTSTILLPPKRNRAALREYYNLKASSNLTTEPSTNDAASSTSSIHDNNSLSEVSESELDHPSFNSSSYVTNILQTQSLAELLRTYNGILTDIRALDAEKEALVYDNYSKLIAATETIRRMRDNMDPLNPMAGTLDPAIKSVYERAEGIKEELRRGMEGSEVGEKERERIRKRRKMGEVVRRVLDAPERIRVLVGDGEKVQAERVWEEALVLLERWKERGVGGTDVLDCIEDGEAALRGEPAGEKSWEVVKRRRAEEAS